MSINIELAEKVLNFIEHHSDRHYQRSWMDSECGTTACIAGHTMLASGEFIREQDEDGYWILVDRRTGREPHPRAEGQRLLGLTEEQAGNIFLDMNETSAIAKLRELVHRAKHERHRLESTENASE